MNREPRHRNDYSARQVQAAHRVLVDVGQVLSSFRDAIVVVGGWVPDLLLPDAEPEHVGSIDVDLALDTEKLGAGRYAELLKLLLHTGRYQKGDKDFQLVADVDLEDGEPPVRVEVEFLAPSEVKLKKNRPKLTKGFRVLQFPACAVAFQNPENVEIEGSMISGATNKVRFRVASISDFIIMKAQRWRAATSRRTCTTCVIALTRTRAGSPLSPKNGDRAWETRSRIAHLKAHMGGMMLIEITPDIIAEYQGIRLKEGALGSTINAEVMFALRLMGEIGDAVRLKLKRERRIRLPKNKNSGTALMQEEEAALLQAARVPVVIKGGKMDLKATRSPAIRPAIMLALNTTMRESEIRTLRWEQIDFLKRIITVGESKTSAGTGRTIPINAELFSTLAEHKTWYEINVCPVDSQLYVFPFGDCRKYYPERPISSFKTSWKNVRKKAGVTIRFHDLRHTAITKLAESGAPDETIMAIAGHVSREMLTHYAHIRTEAKRRALEAISTRPEPAAERVKTRKVVS